ncbi:MAG: hypothetical protein WBP45_08820 [Daejeonella sp.]
MKKLLIATGLALTTALSSFAAPLGPTGIDASILSSFSGKFLSAENVQWVQRPDYTEAKFTWQNQLMQAFYSTEGEIIAVSRKIKYENLPLTALMAIEERYAGYTNDETIEMNSTEDGLRYYVSIKNQSKKIILKITPQGELSIFKKENL